MRESRANRKVLVGAAAALVAAGAVAYTVVASRQVLDEAQAARPDAEIARKRLAPETPGYFSALNPNRQASVEPPPRASCSTGAMPLLEQAAAALADERTALAPVQVLEQALASDPSCVGAARILVHQLSRAALQVKLRGWVADADAAPGDAAAQLKAAYYERVAGDGAAYRRYLERATAVSPDQPLLHGAWSYYWLHFADPVSMADALREGEAEVRVTGDLASVTALAKAYVDLGDDAQALRWCDRYYADAPGSKGFGMATWCVEAAIRWGDRAREPAAVERLLASETVNVSRACKHANLASTYVRACRVSEGLAEAEAAVAGGCVLPSSGARRVALMRLGRLEEAALPPTAGRYWGSEERVNHAIALAAAGRPSEARDVALGASPGDDAGSGHAGMPAGEAARRQAVLLAALLDAGVPADRWKPAMRCEPGNGEADRLVRSAMGYLTALMLDESRVRLDRALALEPRNAEAWTARVYQLSVEGKLPEAAEAGEAALAAGADGPGVAANLGYVYQQMGRCDRAVPLFERVRERSPLAEANYRNLAKCLDALGRSDDARAVWALIPGGKPGEPLWTWIAGLTLGVVVLYLGGKWALIQALPDRFGHWRFP